MCWVALERYFKVNGYIEIPVKEGDQVRICRFEWRDIKKLIEIQCEPPSIETRNKLEEAQCNQIKLQAKVLSPQTWQQQDGLDPDHEQANIEEAAERSMAMNPLPMPDDDGQDDGGDGSETRRRPGPGGPGSGGTMESRLVRIEEGLQVLLEGSSDWEESCTAQPWQIFLEARRQRRFEVRR